MTPRVIVRLHEKIQEMAAQLAEKRYVTLSGLFTQLILAEVKRDAITDPNRQQLTGVRPVGRPRQGAEYKEITRLIDRAERFPVAFRKELAEVEGLYDAMFGEIQARLDKAIEERDGPTLEGLAQGQEWQEARDLYWEKQEAGG